MKLNINTNSGMYLILLFLAGTVLRVIGISGQSIGPDEFITARFAADSNLITLFWNSFASQPHPPLFFMLQHIICNIFGYSETSLRLLPLLFSIAAMPVFYRLVRAFFSEKISLTAFFLFVLNPYLVYYSQEAAVFSMFLFVSLILTYYFLMSVKYNSFLLKPFVLWSVIGIYTHSLTAVLLIVFNLLIFIKYRDEIRINLWIKAQIIIFIFILPVMPFLLKGVSGVFLRANTLMAPFIALKDYLFGFTADFNFISGIGFAAALYLIIMAVFTYNHKNMKIISVISWVVFLYFVIPWLAAVFGRFIYPESGLILLCALVLVLLAIGISYLSREGIILALTVMFMFYGVAFYNYFGNEKYRKIDYKKQYSEFVKEAKEGAFVVHSSINSYSAFEFYNRVKHRSNFENRYIGKISETKKKGIRFNIRSKWEKFRDETLINRFKLEIRGSEDKNLITEDELAGKIRNYREVWFINDDGIGIKQPWLPAGSVWHSKIQFSSPLNVKEIKWVKNWFNIKEEKKYYGTVIYKMERRWQ
ncbi:MAG: glycosyltransferase family 39 protein [Candidatus Goldbacteria bacterium]|nr:glycosyltransferase family 39 protein [Candidatus Goldiibacteriota bacterium]